MNDEARTRAEIERLLFSLERPVRGDALEMVSEYARREGYVKETLQRVLQMLSGK